MSLGTFFQSQNAAGNLELASRLRISAEHLRGLNGPAQTMLRVTGVTWETQANKQNRALAVGQRPPRDLSFPALEGTDAITGLPALLVLQAGSLTYECARLVSADRSLFGPFDSESLNVETSVRLNEALDVLVNSGLVVIYEGEGEKDGKTFARYRLIQVVECADETVRAYVDAWHADARAHFTRPAITQGEPLQEPLQLDPPADPIPF